MISSSRCTIVAALALSFSFSCSSDSPNGGSCPAIESNNNCETESGDDRFALVTPLEIYTGTNGRDTYQAAVLANVGDFEITSSNESVACVGRYGCLAKGDFGIVAVVSAQGAGDAELTFQSGAFSQRVPVHVAAYTEADYDLGDKRYNDPDNANATTRVACASCHQGQGGAPHSPIALAGKSDSDLLKSVLESKYADTCENEDGLCNCTPQNGDCSACTEVDCDFNEAEVLSLEGFGGGPGDHIFDLTEAERTGVIAYIRGLAIEFDALPQ